MTREARRVLFLILFLIFLIITPLIILYGQGYRFDFEKKKITQTGGLFLKVLPKQVEIYLNGEFQKRTDFFFGSALIEDLLPRRYKIEIKKEGYLPWQKELEIEEKKVTEAKNILLFPEKMNSEILFKDINFLSFSPNQTKLVFREKDTQELKLYDLEKRVKSHLLKVPEILAIQWEENSKRLILKSAEKEKIKYFLLEIIPETKIFPLTFLKENLWEVFFHPLDSQKIFLLSQEKNSLSLFEGDIKEKRVNPQPILEKVVSCQTFKENIFCLLENGFLFEINPLSKEKKEMNLQPIEIKKETDYQIFWLANNLYLKEGGDLFAFNQNLKSFEKIFENFSDFQISPDKKKMVFSKDKEIWLYFLTSSERKEKGKYFLTRFSEKIGKIIWLNPHYLIFTLQNQIKIIETDERDKPQTWLVAEFKNPQIFFSQRNNILYIFSEEKLYQLTELIF